MTAFENQLPERFEVLGELGRGGTSVVIHARDRENDQEVAVKLLLKDTEEDRFQREAERLASLSHPNVVSFLEVGHHEGRDFLVMEYLEMGDLTSYLTKLNVVDILRLFSQVCDGLAHLHDRGIVHRDIKPANILVGKEGVPKITDLGVARQVDRNTRLTQAGTILGTYSYLAPEQILSSTVGPKADIYSLGVCLYGALTGKRLFEADNEFKMLKAHLEEPPPHLKDSLPGCPDELDSLLQDMLAKNADDRPRSARAVADRLQESIRELEEKNQDDLLPAWDEKIEELPEDQRSVLLALSFLGGEATFETVCRAAPFAEDRTDRCLEALVSNKLVDSPTDDQFRLTVPDETIQTRLTPRVRKLFASRLAALEQAQESEAATVTVAEPVGEEEVTVINEPSPEVVELQKSQETPPPGDQRMVTQPAAESKSRKPRWAAISAFMVLLGIMLAAGAQWYWAHSASLAVTSQPIGGTVSLNGLEQGETPLTITGLRPGVQALAISKDGHRGLKETVELGFQQTQELHFTLDPIVGKLLLTLNPRDASITIDDKVYGQINSDLSLTAGAHKLAVEKEGYEPYRSEIVIEEERALELEVALTPISAQLEVLTEPAGATVALDGKEKGKTPLTLEKVAFGSHELAVRLAGHERVNKTVEVKNKEPLKVEATLKELPGGLKITSEPQGAKLKINGKVEGETPKLVTGLSADLYTITLAKDGYEVVSEKKKVIAGQETKVHFTLQKIVVAPPEPPPSRPIYRPPPPRPPVRPPSRPPARPPSNGSGGNPWIVE